MMYEELIKRLRETSMYFGEADHVSVMLLEAADAIEGLSGLVEHYGGETGIKNLQEYTDKYWNTLSKIPRWFSVTEKLPREQETVLTWGKQGVILLDWRHDNEWCCFGEATHWMPLPDPPKEET